MDEPVEGAESEPQELQKLPPGRHGLPREYVKKNQRDRLAAGIIAAVAEHGYHETTIAQIATAAGVSRRTFYAYFSSKEECFVDTYDALGDYLAEAMGEAGAGEECWLDKVRAQLGALLETFAANPNLVCFSLVAAPAAGGDFNERYRAFLERLMNLVVKGRPQGEEPAERLQGAEYAMAGALAGLLVAKVNAGEGEGERLPELLPELLELVLAPYIGREQAAAEARRPPAR